MLLALRSTNASKRAASSSSTSASASSVPTYCSRGSESRECFSAVHCMRTSAVYSHSPAARCSQTHQLREVCRSLPYAVARQALLRPSRWGPRRAQRAATKQCRQQKVALGRLQVRDGHLHTHDSHRASRA